ncbi:phage head closure protein [Cohnella lubricantis]|uniref:Phage head closure protein n=1 Tax=Cohnella lubricantis TaxID=2163172 RepID=A0A841TGD5_9BACL|nr:phage head closure protein [Cohnella lubricantis]MBB6677521.1 phage head closure protein [Cohnella lubricantis]MBP2116593.1 SPP1 family predicted phage head-tail adaptor [Cohnella lubricantis]
MSKQKRLWNEAVQLIKVTTGEDAGGYPIDPVESSREVLANELSVKRSEFYAANQSGMRADVVFEIHAIEYEDEKLLEHAGKRYEVIRTYSSEPEYIELTCSDISQRA